ncbi:MAG: hypothetical protein OQK55_10135 [Thermoanaerobaculales bacterium]|nr:hypothetical protein [Thermoanaerobaculales bacterium]
MSDTAFGEWLVKQKLLRPDGLRRAMAIYRDTQSRLDTVILDLGLMGESNLLDALGRFHKTRTVSRAEFSAAEAAAKMLSPRVAFRMQAVPFRVEGKTLSVATLNPGDLLVEDELALITGCMVASYVTLEMRLYEALNHLYGIPLSAQYTSLITRFDGEGADARGPVVAMPRVRLSKAEQEAAQERTWRPKEHTKRPAIRDEELEVSAEDLDLFPSLRTGEGEGSVETPAPPVLRELVPPAADLEPEERLAATAETLQHAEMRDDIADAVLGFCAPLFRRRLMLVVRKGTVMGWRGEGDGIDQEKLRRISIPLADPSVFVGLTQGTEFWLGPIPEMPRNMDFVAGLGGTAPKDCFILPVTVREKTVCFLYCDNVEDGVGGLPMADLRRLTAKAGLAFQVYIMKSKIRTL